MPPVAVASWLSHDLARRVLAPPRLPEHGVLASYTCVDRESLFRHSEDQLEGGLLLEPPSLKPEPVPEPWL